MKKVGEIVGGILVLVFLAFQAGAFDAGAMQSFSAPKQRAQAPNPWSSGAPEVARRGWSDSGGPPEDATAPLDAAPQSLTAPQPRAMPATGPAPASVGNAYYPNCAAARSAGAAPIYRGQPGYRSPLDRDNDGVACEPYRGRRQREANA